MTELRKRSVRAALIVAHRANVPEAIDRVRMTEEIVALRRLMTPWRQVGEHVGIAPTTALRWYRDALAAEVNHESRADALAAELDTCNALQAAWWGRATGAALDKDGDPILDEKAAAIVLKVMAQRARLMGLDAPIVIDSGDPAEVVAAAIVAHLSRRQSEL